MRNKQGQFAKGHRSSPATEFKKGQHWRPRRPWWNKEWLVAEYVTRKRTAVEIAAEYGVTPPAILYWLRKHGISRRTLSQTHAIKYWGDKVKGEKNPMYGRRGPGSPAWDGGKTPMRQRECNGGGEWEQLVGEVWLRDGGVCKRCGADRGLNRRKMHVHHIVPIEYEPLRRTLSNLCLLCAKCQQDVHRHGDPAFLKDPP